MSGVESKPHSEPEIFWFTVEGHHLDEPLVRKSAYDGLLEQHEALLAEWRDYRATTQDVIDGLQEQNEVVYQDVLKQMARAEAAEDRSTELQEQLEASQAILDDIARALDIFDMSGNDIGAGLTSEETLGFIRDAMDRRGSNPASEPKGRT